MRFVFATSFLILLTMGLFSQDSNLYRKPYAAGSYYSSDKDELLQDLSTMFKECKKASSTGLVRAIVVPHAGYVFSGKTAATGFASTPSEGQYKNIFLIGSSHVASFNGASVYCSKEYYTPLGNVKVNKEIADDLKLYSVFSSSEGYHDKDHCLEVEMPLIQYYYKDEPKVIPIIIGTSNRSILKEIAKILEPYFTEDNLFVISSDFSHYPSYYDAITIDSLTAEGFMSGDPDTFLKSIRKNETRNTDNLATSMCAWTTGVMFLEMTKSMTNLQFKKIDYCNSGDSPYGDKEGVVGYNAIQVYDINHLIYEDLDFDSTDSDILFDIARKTIEAHLNGQPSPKINDSDIPPAMKGKYGAFVTLQIDGELRGCIGKFISDDPLYEAVQESAYSSAFEDPRFNALTLNEYKKVTMEITVLGPMKKITNKDDIILGKHGIYIKKGGMAGTMLPQVAIENDWDVDTFLGYTSQYKAGIGWNGWKTADLYIYEGVVLKEE
ncbi:MAG: AmmeMemoRadiSam system protein B [Bacteroidales bacterium]|nr:AmmeMemoRadiSam system protein B [Bacteroidales bacterium]